ncbi:hypothetical protein BGZ95_001458 [Linnemannia exigua]|uniref:LysM domain-containing protein n=1 Tax=Linnemannia exigua TaxID=604196 RepID=A0AAD4DM57_9FUNG|nr:hypothetical protein BGZ95_001458 [Linnemannia exigua]
MKFTISAVVLALAATSQVAAVVPKPVKECTRSYVVEPGTPGCKAFAEKFGVTFPDLLKWNTKLSEKCDNLDIGFPICVSVTPGECCLNENPKNVTVPKLGDPKQPEVWDSTPYTKTPTGNPPTTSTGVVPPPAATTTNPATTSKTPSPVKETPKPPASAASSSKASMVLAAAGVVLSVAYML